MGKILFKVYKKIVWLISLPVILKEYFSPQTGKDYKISFLKKISIFFKFISNAKKVQTASDPMEHLIMATKIMNIPKDLPGSVVECGCFKGGSATNLSIICGLCGRTLEVFDSFKGLPEPKEDDKNHHLMFIKEVHTYEKEAFAGTLEEVKSNISRHGNIKVCKFHEGFFENSLKNFKEKVVFCFVDVDLTSSLQDCIKHIWPLMQDNSCLFSHEAEHKEIVGLFYDSSWWSKALNTKDPGFIGGATGLGLLPYENGFRSGVGYTIKNSKDWLINPQV